MTLNHINVNNFLSAYCVLTHSTSTPLVLPVTHWWCPSHFWRRQVNNAVRSALLLIVSSWVRARARIYTDLAFCPHHPNQTAQQVLWKVLLFLCHFSEVHFPLPQLHKKPIRPAGDLVPLVGFLRAGAPFQRVPGLLPSTQCGQPGGPGSWAVGHPSLWFLLPSTQTACFSLFCDSSLTCPESHFHLPFSPSQTPVSHSWDSSTQHQGRAETILPAFVIGAWGNCTETHLMKITFELPVRKWFSEPRGDSW